MDLGPHYATHRSFSLHKGKNSFGWLPAEASNRMNRRTSYLRSIEGISDARARAFLVDFWECMKESEILVTTKTGSGLDARKFALPLAIHRSAHMQGVWSLAA